MSRIRVTSHHHPVLTVLRLYPNTDSHTKKSLLRAAHDSYANDLLAKDSDTLAAHKNFFPPARVLSCADIADAVQTGVHGTLAISQGELPCSVHTRLIVAASATYASLASSFASKDSFAIPLTCFCVTQPKHDSIRKRRIAFRYSSMSDGSRSSQLRGYENTLRAAL